MIPTHRSVQTVLILSAALAFSGPGSARGQETGGWRVEPGGGVGVVVSGHDRSNGGQWIPTARVLLDRSLGSGVRLGAVWIGSWPASRLAGGRERRHHVGLAFSYQPRASGPVLSASVGPGLATVVDQDGPPEPPHVGDVVISVGETTGFGASASAGWAASLGGLGLVPRAGVLVQRVQGHTLTQGSLTVGVVLGP